MQQLLTKSLEDPIDYYPGHLDYAAVEEFLRLLNPRPEAQRVALLAASIAQKTEGDTAGDLVKIAMDIQAESEKAVIGRRDAILARMNLSTIQRLVEMLRHLDSTFSEGDEGEDKQGPYRSFLSAAIERRTQVKVDWPEKYHAHQTEKIGKALSQADGRTKIPRPKTPCDLATALQYVSGENDISAKALESALIDFLSIRRLETTKDDDLELEKSLRHQLDEISQDLSKSQEGAKTPSNKTVNPTITRLQQGISRLEEERTFRENFKPGMKVPSQLKTDTIYLFAVYSSKSDSVTLSTLAWLADNFYPFWVEYRSSYLTQHLYTESKRKATSKSRKESGIKGFGKREYDRWVAIVKDWLKYAAIHKKRPDEIIDVFMNGRTEIKTKDARARFASGLKTLQNHVTKKKPAESTVVDFKLVGVKSMNSEIVQACADLIEEYEGKKSGKPRRGRQPSP